MWVGGTRATCWLYGENGIWTNSSGKESPHSGLPVLVHAFLAMSLLRTWKPELLRGMGSEVSFQQFSPISLDFR